LREDEIGQLALGHRPHYLGQGLADITPRIARADDGRTS
jgi:hypothetical protein